MKTAIKNTLLYGFFLMLIVIFTFICFDGAKKVTASLNAKDTYVTLQATITSANAYVETDEGVDREYWHANVTYSYNGVVYSDVYYERMSRAPEIGKAVTVRIDPQNPGELLPDGADVTLAVILSPIFLAGLTAVLYYLVLCAVEAIAEKRGQQNAPYAKTAALVLSGGKLVIENIVFYSNHHSLVYAVFSLIAVAGICFLCFRGKSKEAETQTDRMQ